MKTKSGSAALAAETLRMGAIELARVASGLTHLITESESEGELLFSITTEIAELAERLGTLADQTDEPR